MGVKMGAHKNSNSLAFSYFFFSFFSHFFFRIMYTKSEFTLLERRLILPPHRAQHRTLHTLHKWPTPSANLVLRHI